MGTQMQSLPRFTNFYPTVHSSQLLHYFTCLLLLIQFYGIMQFQTLFNQSNRYLNIGASRAISNHHVLPRTSRWQERRVYVGGIRINFVEFGSGAHSILCLPGLAGSIQSDFAPIFDQMNSREFRIVSWDPPGYGRSRPFKRDHAGNFYERDAHLVMGLMDKLGYEKFSLLGWSNGGMTGYTAAAHFPNRIRKLVMWGTHAYFDEKTREFISFIRNLKNWSPPMLSAALQVYDEKYLSILLQNWADATIEASLGEINSIFSKNLRAVMCPTLALHGTQDVVLGEDHCDFFRKHVKNCKIHLIQNAGHNLHLSRTREFLDITEAFLLE